jgi:pyruvate dehydrogenase E2 component (dihydrolipoamide acetyltransferase)
MARLDFKLPDIGEGVTEGEIVEWFVRVGDAVREDDPMVEVMTDKATVTIGAPCDGSVERLCFEVGGVAKVGQVILSLDAKTVSRPAASAVGEIEEELPGARLFAGPAAGTSDSGRERRSRRFAAPSAGASRRAAPGAPERTGRRYDRLRAADSPAPRPPRVVPAPAALDRPAPAAAQPGANF